MKKVSFLSALIILLTYTVSAQVTVGFQGGEPGDTWGYTSTGADPSIVGESMQSPNIASGSASLVVGGNAGGGSCFAGGSGNGPSTVKKFTFNTLDISTSSNSVRTFTLNWGNRFPSCNGTGWDAGENLMFVAYHNGVAQPQVTLANGNNNATFSIATHQHSWSIPACVTSFSFEIWVTTNRKDELLFIDNAKVTAPALNAPIPAPSPIAGDITVCIGGTETLSVISSPNTTYMWSGLPAGASFTSPNGTAASNTINIDWGTAVPGVYTISVIPTTMVCGVATPGTAATIDITVTASPALTVTADTSICAGQSVPISASGAANYSWNNGLGTGSTFTVTPTATTTYAVTGSNGNCSATDSVTVTILPSPVITVTASPASICSGGSATLTASGGTTYTWLPADGLATTTGAAVTVNPSATTTYTVTGTAGGCEATATVTVTVVNTPVLVVTGAATICAGQSTQISASGATNYTWDNGLGAGSTFTVTPTTTTTYTVTGSNGNCTATATVTVSVAPASVITITPSSSSICAGGSVTLTASGATTYIWLPAPGLTAVSGAVVTVNPPATTTYTVGGTNGTCPGTASITISVDASPVIVAGNDMTVCTGNPVTLNGSGADTYTWDNGVTDGIAFIPAATATYTLTGTTASGCAGTDDVVITVEDAPTVAFSSDFQAGCLPVTVQFSNTSTGAATYEWNFEDGTLSTDQNPLHIFTDSGCKDITLTAASPNGCSSVVTTADYICTDPNPTAIFAVNPTALDESNPKAAMINTSENATDYLWNFGDLTTSIEESPEHIFTPSETGNYVVTLFAFNANGCVDSAKTVLPFSEVPIYYVPNVFTPDGNEFNQTFQPVFTSGFDPFRYNMQIFNRWGENIFESNDAKIGWDGVSVDGTIVPDGTYTWRIAFSVKNSDDKKMIMGHLTLVR